MGVRILKLITPGSRFVSRSDFSELTSAKPEKSLTVALRKREEIMTGKITVRRKVVVIKEDIVSLISKEISLVLKEKLQH